MRLISRFWQTLIAILSIASVGFGVCAVFAAWFLLSLVSTAGGLLECDHGGRLFGCQFDPGGNYGNALQNYLQLLLLFANLSLASALGAGVASVRSMAMEHSEHLQAIRRHVAAKAVSAPTPSSAPENVNRD